MPVHTEEVIRACNILAEQENLTVAVTESAKGACAIGLCALIGGLLGGPAGLGVGGVIGSVAAAYKGQGKYKSVVHIMTYEMNTIQKARLVAALTNALRDIGIEEVAMLSSMVLSKGLVQDIMVRELTNFFKNEMGYALTR